MLVRGTSSEVPPGPLGSGTGDRRTMRSPGRVITEAERASPARTARRVRSCAEFRAMRHPGLRGPSLLLEGRRSGSNGELPWGQVWPWCLRGGVRCGGAGGGTTLPVLFRAASVSMSRLARSGVTRCARSEGRGGGPCVVHFIHGACRGTAPPRARSSSRDGLEHGPVGPAHVGREERPAHDRGASLEPLPVCFPKGTSARRSALPPASSARGLHALHSRQSVRTFWNPGRPEPRLEPCSRKASRIRVHPTR